MANIDWDNAFEEKAQETAKLNDAAEPGAKVKSERENAKNAINETAFMQGFIEAMFFTESGYTSAADWFETDSDERTSDGQLPCDVGYSDIHPDSLKDIRTACAEWENANGHLLAQAYSSTYDAEDAGRDYWFTRNGHGVGFWDRGLGDVGEALTEASGRKEVHVFFGDHVEYGNEPFVHVDI